MATLRELLQLQAIIKPEDTPFLLLPNKRDLEYLHTYDLRDTTALARAAKAGVLDEKYGVYESNAKPRSWPVNLMFPLDNEPNHWIFVYEGDKVITENIQRVLDSRKVA